MAKSRQARDKLEEPGTEYIRAKPILKKNWQSHIRSLPRRVSGSEPKPNSLSISRSLELHKILQDSSIHPSNITASAEGGILWEFLEKDRYCLVEIFNDGDIVFLKRKANGYRSALDLSFEQLKEKITALLDE